MLLFFTALAALGLALALAVPNSVIVGTGLIIVSLNGLFTSVVLHRPRLAAVVAVLAGPIIFLTLGTALFFTPTLIVCFGVVAWHVMDRLLHRDRAYNVTIDRSTGPELPAGDVAPNFHVFR